MRSLIEHGANATAKDNVRAHVMYIYAASSACHYLSRQ